MANGRVRYQEWMDALVGGVGTTNERDEELERVVRRALASLTAQECELAERRFLMGQSTESIQCEMALSLREVERGLREVTIKLRRMLAPFVTARFNIRPEAHRNCRLCECADKASVERIIATKREDETWRRIMSELEGIGVKVNSPQMLIGHVKYHLG